jgi:hypothetical protein
MDFNKLKENRSINNKLILDILYNQLESGDLRFNQLMYIINETNDYFNEEPHITLKRIKEKLNIID